MNIINVTAFLKAPKPQNRRESNYPIFNYDSPKRKQSVYLIVSVTLIWTIWVAA